MLLPIADEYELAFTTSTTTMAVVWYLILFSLYYDGIVGYCYDASQCLLFETEQHHVSL